MFNQNKKETSHPLDDVISKLIKELSEMTSGDEAYEKAVQSLKTLTELREADKAAASKPFISPELMITAATHILGIGMILGFEKANVITSKSLSLVPKIR